MIYTLFNELFVIAGELSCSTFSLHLVVSDIPSLPFMHAGLEEDFSAIQLEQIKEPLFYETYNIL